MTSPYNSTNGVQFAWDSTSLGWLKTCPRLYQYSMLEGYRLNADKPDLTFGIHYHTALEHYDRQCAAGAGHAEALHEATRRVLADSWGWESDHTTKNRETLVRSVVWYLDHFADDAARTLILANGKPAVELSFRMDIGEGNLLCGHLDRVVTYAGGVYVMDHKTASSTISSYYFDKFGPDNQMSLYTMAAKVVFNTPVQGVIIDAAQIAVGFTAFSRGFTFRTNAQLEEWMDDTRQYIKMAATFTDASYWPMNDKACNLYGGCAFRRICSKSSEVREMFLNTHYTRTPWNPLIPR
jgi:hypothetical protein